MAKIHTLKISNFRGIQNFEQIFGMSDFICIIGRGDSGKTTILDAISYVLSPNWNLQFFDTDFYNCDINNHIKIEVLLYDLPDKLIKEDKYGLFLRGLDKKTNIVNNIPKEDDEPLLSITLEVQSDLEPKWFVSNDSLEDPKDIKSSDRSALNTFFISDYIDKHFSWNTGTPLYSLLKQENDDDVTASSSVIMSAFREAKSKIDSESFEHFNNVLAKVKSSSNDYGINIEKTTTTIDFRDISIKDGRVCLHEEKIPFRLKGKGSKRLISIAIQTELVKKGGIILVDEIEQGLEPDRIQHLVQTLKNNNHGQVFITTHSRNVLVQLDSENLFLMKLGKSNLITFSNDLQGSIRKFPDAFFSKKVLVCEGATEVGICFSLNKFRIENTLSSAVIKAVSFIDGGGTSQVKYADSFCNSEYDVCLFCDSDHPEVNSKKVGLQIKGIKIVDCSDDFCIEEQIFNDLPWNAVIELVKYKIEEKTEEAIYQSVRSKYGQIEPQSSWLDKDTIELRTALGKASADRTIIDSKTGKDKNQNGNPWFKSLEHGKFLGKIICKNLIDIPPDKKLRNQIDTIFSWIDS